MNNVILMIDGENAKMDAVSYSFQSLLFLCLLFFAKTALELLNMSAICVKLLYMNYPIFF